MILVAACGGCAHIHVHAIGEPPHTSSQNPLEQTLDTGANGSGLVGVGFGSLGEAAPGMSVGTKSKPALVLDSFLEQNAGGGRGRLVRDEVWGSGQNDVQRTLTCSSASC